MCPRRLWNRRRPRDSSAVPPACGARSACGDTAHASGFEIGVHALRAPAATNALDHESDIAREQEWLGHANIATTRIHDRRRTRPEDHPTFEVACQVAQGNHPRSHERLQANSNASFSPVAKPDPISMRTSLGIAVSLKLPALFQSPKVRRVHPNGHTVGEMELRGRRSIEKALLPSHPHWFPR